MKEIDPKNVDFMVDNMLVKLARYLRNMGFDAKCISDKDPARLKQVAYSENRIVVTRDTHFFNNNIEVKCFLI